MRILVTGSSGHLGEALMRALRSDGDAPFGIDHQPSPYTDAVGSIADAAFVQRAMTGIDAVLHTATLHQPHIATHSRQAFVDTNITGTLNLLDAATRAGVRAFVYTSTTSLYGDALTPPAGAPAAWITEDVVPMPKNIYGITKLAAENLCALAHRAEGLPCIVLRTSRFFPHEWEPGKAGQRDPAAPIAFLADADTDADPNVHANEFLHRRVELEDVVSAHRLAITRAPALGFGRYIISATTPFSEGDAQALRENAPTVLRRLIPGFEAEYARRGWTMFNALDRVYDNSRARTELGWQPRWDFHAVLAELASTGDFRSALSIAVGNRADRARRSSIGAVGEGSPAASSGGQQ